LAGQEKHPLNGIGIMGGAPTAGQQLVTGAHEVHVAAVQAGVSSACGQTLCATVMCSHHCGDDHPELVNDAIGAPSFHSLQPPVMVFMQYEIPSAHECILLFSSALLKHGGSDD